MKNANITRFKLDANRPPKSDWRLFDATSEEERHRAALSDPDATPATEAQLQGARRAPSVRGLRQKLNLTQEEFAQRFHLPLGTVRDWEQGAHRPDQAARVLLTVIEKDPDGVARALEKVRILRGQAARSASASARGPGKLETAIDNLRRRVELATSSRSFWISARNRQSASRVSPASIRSSSISA